MRIRRSNWSALERVASPLLRFAADPFRVQFLPYLDVHYYYQEVTCEAFFIWDF
jgi:hypothetical protein